MRWLTNFYDFRFKWTATVGIGIHPTKAWLSQDNAPVHNSNWGDERGCDEGHWHAHTRGLWLGLSEVVGTVQQVHCSQRRLLWSGLEFHVCTINKSAHTKKSLETYLMILILLAYHPCNFCSISAKNTCILFTLGTRCISRYFHSKSLTSVSALIFDVQEDIEWCWYEKLCKPKIRSEK